ncbi:UDP-4-amino-4,6-dideoxy-N-acetyl-beta-L-altrosamine transaminase [Rhizobium sp. C4]|uniref:UDP-4-amino-4, 6-dideoxy-N-acetyl-beta-L-altrosamine transaminase n=1 Tax=Rhizobium sp. C4 TaxID=1349800 RepID=UPI001E403064|nr:UDP-4-amino-4,6-dideoxy-N-acetyl-beta-L-altrosamine transaminase [Rhizobium sp. C4]MCD2176138.1 UDP-4-amino-4,6-dideoxy-N-acetyl-beta-L-altrosamine transaminase [Rhizobium sp. C4]
MIPYGHHDINQDDIAAVVAVLKSDFLTQGPQVPAFESAVAQKVGAAHAVAVNSATSALHIACLALGLGPGDRLWTSPITFVASANCALYCGASVDFVDIDPKTFNIDPVALEAKLIAAKVAGTLPKVVVPVALCGQSADLKAIRVLADRFGFFILEDASHGIGARYDGNYMGDGRYADITVFSFHPVKIISTAEGGMATTNDPVLARRMQILRSHGITREQHEMTHESDGAWYYQQVDLGYNYRMTELQAALGISQMSRLDEFVSARADRARSYDQALADLALRLPYQAPMTASSWHLYVIQLADASRHRAVFDALRADGIGVNLHYIPVHLQPYYLAKGFTKGDFPMAEDYYARSISIPLFSHITDAQLQAVVDAVKKHVGV